MNTPPRKIPVKKLKRGQDGASRVKKRETAPKECELCGYTKVTQLHRIHPGRDRNKLWPNGGTYVLGNVISLCPTHHAEADRDWIPREELSAVVQRRIDREGIGHLQDVRTLPHIRVLPPAEAKVASDEAQDSP